MRLRWLAVVVVLSLAGGCGGTEENPVDSASAGSDGGDQNASSGTDNAKKPAVQIVEFGLGQSASSVDALVIVTTDDESAVGEFVTVTANFLDADGQIIATEEQVETFSWVGQELVLPVRHFLDDPNVVVATIDPSVSLSDYGSREPVRPPLPVLEASEIREGESGGYTTAFGFTNDTEADLEDVRVGVVCYDEARRIIGGGSTYPSVAPAGKTIRIEADPTVTGTPTSCKAFLNYG